MPTTKIETVIFWDSSSCEINSWKTYFFVEQAVHERETAANDFADALNDAIVSLDSWRKDKNYRLNNTEIVLAIDQVKISSKTHFNLNIIKKKIYLSFKSIWLTWIIIRH